MNPTPTELRDAKVFLIGGLLAVLVVLLLSNKDALKWMQPKTTVPFRLVMKNSIVGIEKGSAVRYLGVRCGEVLEARTSRENVNSVELIIAVESWQRITPSTRARLASEGLIKNYYVELFGSQDDEPELAVGSIIPADSSTMRQLMEAGSNTVERLDAALARLQVWLSDENMKKVVALVDNATAMLGTIDSTVKNLEPDARRMLTGVSKVTEDLDSFYLDHRGEFRTIVQDFAGSMSRLRKFLESGRLEALADSTTNTMNGAGKDIEALRAAATNWMRANEFGEEVKKAVDTFASLEMRVSSMMATLDSEIATLTRSQIAPTMLGLRDAARALEDLASLLRSNPSLLIFSKPVEETPLPRSPEPLK